MTQRRQIQSLQKKKTICKHSESRMDTNIHSLAVKSHRPFPKENLVITMKALDTSTRYKAMNVLTRQYSQSCILWKIIRKVKIRTSMLLTTTIHCLSDIGQSPHHSRASITAAQRIKRACASLLTQIYFSSTVAGKLKFKRQNES